MTSEIKNRKNRGQPTKPEYKPSQFINHTFTEDDKRGFKTWASEHGAEFWDMCDRLMDDGYSLSVKPDAYNDCLSAFLSTNAPKSPNYGFILTGRSHSSCMAVYAVFYRHYVLFEGDWPTDTAHRSGMDDD